ncbi:hypothetical protein GFS03_04045 [Sulfolobus sp. E5-1-F]|uniref:hypothetical protein n=1 Tax=Saccharolobus sp. E5-1-F TaxID=2663019 RepID=UPI001294C2FA|nr:hypothetical protein [Sulfolobus sp. E5-1-F]QGA53813.1 hypothetical protein GFS03_04045 [Sulfolobus sp. E5-1-F]
MLKFLSERNAKFVDYIILALLDLILIIDFTRLGNIYAIDSNIFPFNNQLVELRYLEFSVYGFSPWTYTIGGFSLETFLVNFPIYLFSNLPYSSIFYEFFFLYIGSILIYEVVIDIIGEFSKIARLASIIATLYFALGPNSGGISDDLFEQIYIYYIAIPLFIFLLIKFFNSKNFLRTLEFFLLLIPSLVLIYYYAIPVYALSTAIFIGTILVFYSIKSLMEKKFFKVSLLGITLALGVLLKHNEILTIYKSFASSKSFIFISYYYWVSNSYGSPLFATLRGINYIFGSPPIYIDIASFAIPILYLFSLMNRKTSKNSEILLFLSLSFIFAFLYSMPNVPFQHFWEKLFFEFPILTDIRTQYILVSPFEGLAFSYAVGFGSYALFDMVRNKRRVYKLLSIILVALAIIVVPFNVLTEGGGQSIVHVPTEFLSVTNYLNGNSNYNMSVIIFPIFLLENAEAWYHGPSIFPLFLKPIVILGGIYYSPSSIMYALINDFYYNVYYGNVAPKAISYFNNFIYLFNVHDIIVEKTATSSGPLVPEPSGFSIDQLNKGLEEYAKSGLIKLLYNNSLYEIYSTNIKSSMLFVSESYYNITQLLYSNNASYFLKPIPVKYISPIEYVAYINSSYIGKSVYLYLILPYSQGWQIEEGGKILNVSNYFGYILFKVNITNTKLIFYNGFVQQTLDNGIKQIEMMLVLPVFFSFIIYILGEKYLMKKVI